MGINEYDELRGENIALRREAEELRAQLEIAHGALDEAERAIAAAREEGRAAGYGDGLRSLIDRMNQSVSEPTGVFRGHCRWCSMSAATAEERHYPRCVLAELEAIADTAPVVQASSKLVLKLDDGDAVERVIAAARELDDVLDEEERGGSYTRQEADNFEARGADVRREMSEALKKLDWTRGKRP